MAIASGSATVNVNVSVSASKTNTGFNSTTFSQSKSTSASFTSIGAGASAFSEVYEAVRTLAASASETLDLYGSLTNQFGETINFARIKAIVIELLTDTTSSSITVGNAASNPFVGPLGGTTPTISVANGGVWASAMSSATGWTVTNSSNDNLKIVNADASNTATYRIHLIGSIT